MRAYTYSPTSACRCAVSGDQVGFQQLHLDGTEIDLLDEQVNILCWRFVSLCLRLFFLATLAAWHEGMARSVWRCHFWSRLKYLDNYWMDCNKTLSISDPQRTNHTDVSGALFPVAPSRGWCLVQWNFVWHSLCSKSNSKQCRIKTIRQKLINRTDKQLR